MPYKLTQSFFLKFMTHCLLWREFASKKLIGYRWQNLHYSWDLDHKVDKAIHSETQLLCVSWICIRGSEEPSKSVQRQTTISHLMHCVPREKCASHCNNSSTSLDLYRNSTWINPAFWTKQESTATALCCLLFFQARWCLFSYRNCQGTPGDTSVCRHTDCPGTASWTQAAMSISSRKQTQMSFWKDSDSTSGLQFFGVV